MSRLKCIHLSGEILWNQIYDWMEIFIGGSSWVSEQDV